jgi:hypothetical protein
MTILGRVPAAKSSPEFRPKGSLFAKIINPRIAQRGGQPQPKREPRIPLMGTDGTARDRSKDQESQITNDRLQIGNGEFGICNL